MVTIGPITEDQIRYVHANMWARGKDELALMDIDPADILDIYLGRRSGPFSFGIYGEEGQCLAFMGAEKVAEEENEIYATWFQATEEFVKYAWSATKAIRKFLKGEVAKHPGATLLLHSASQQHGVDRWFSLLGFELFHDGYPRRLYRYGAK